MPPALTALCTSPQRCSSPNLPAISSASRGAPVWVGSPPACSIPSSSSSAPTAACAQDGTPIARGFHTGHWEVGLLVAEAARELRNCHAISFAGACTAPWDGRTQSTVGMLASLAYRNDAAIVLRRLMRSLPTRKGVLGIATCDKVLPAMMMALASSGSSPSILVPGGVTLLPEARTHATR
jgi:dihydroxyacid dehydratase/phosphogluconate dehydratase